MGEKIIPSSCFIPSLPTVLITANGSTTVIPEEGPVPGPPFIDFPPHLRKSGPPDSPSESSLTSAEDLENRRLERKMDSDHFPPDMRYI